jgi:predicted nucleotidyltransferase
VLAEIGIHIPDKQKIIVSNIRLDCTIRLNSVAGYGAMITGTTSRKIKTEIRSALSNDDIVSIYGFGSFFRNEEYNDVDIIAVTSSPIEKLLDVHRKSCADLGRIQQMFGIKIDFTLLTESEFKNAPLRDRHELIELNSAT